MIALTDHLPRAFEKLVSMPAMSESPMFPSLLFCFEEREPRAWCSWRERSVEYHGHAQVIVTGTVDTQISRLLKLKIAYLGTLKLST